MEPVEQCLTKAQRRKQKSSRIQPAAKTQLNSSLRLAHISPLTLTQQSFFRAFNKFDVISLHGFPGTGKTFLALYLALQLLETDKTYHSVKIVRSNVSVRDIGFLPGSAKEKMAAFEPPYTAIVQELYGRGDAYEILKKRDVIEFIPTSHMRGMTLRDSIVIIDECQNMSFQELDTMVTRFGESCKMILCGDVAQDDLTSERYKQESGYAEMMKILSKVESATAIEFGINDIVRSGFVKEYIIAKLGHLAKPKKSEQLDLYEDIALSVMLTE